MQNTPFRRTRAFITTTMTLGVSALSARRAEAQTDASAIPTASASQKLAIVIFAEASAREVSFKAQPRLHVTLAGALDSVHVVERRNLPSPVVAGTTYRDVYVAVEIFGRLNADCITQTLTGGAKLDCASLELRGTTRPPSDTGKTPRS